MHFINTNGVSIFCNSNGRRVCHIDVGYYPTVDPELYNLLPNDLKSRVDGIFNNTQYDDNRKRTELNYLLNKDVPQDILQKYSDILSTRINNQVHESLRRSGIYEPCFPFCNKYGNKLTNLSERIVKNVHDNLRRSGIYDPCFPFCNSRNPMFRDYRSRRYY